MSPKTSALYVYKLLDETHVYQKVLRQICFCHNYYKKSGSAAILYQPNSFRRLWCLVRSRLKFSQTSVSAHRKILFQEASRMADCFSKPSNSQHKTSAVVSQLLLLMLLTTWLAVFKYESLRSSSQRKFVAYKAVSLLSQIQSVTTRARISFNARAADEFSGVARICSEEGQSWRLCHEALAAGFMAGCSRLLGNYVDL